MSYLQNIDDTTSRKISNFAWQAAEILDVTNEYSLGASSISAALLALPASMTSMRGAMFEIGLPRTLKIKLEVSWLNRPVWKREFH